MAIWIHEARLLLRSRLALAALLLMALLSAAAVAAGMAEVARQRAAIDAVATAQAEDIAAVADYVDRTKDGGSAAYNSFHPTWGLAVAAGLCGDRDARCRTLYPAGPCLGAGGADL